MDHSLFRFSGENLVNLLWASAHQRTKAVVGGKNTKLSQIVAALVLCAHYWWVDLIIINLRLKSKRNS